MKKIVILTGSELRHRFFRKMMASYTDIDVLRSYTESLDGSLKDIADKNSAFSELELFHLKAREQVEEDFFLTIDRVLFDHSNEKSIYRGTVNDPDNVKEIIALNPDVIVAYGCSIIKGHLLSAFKNRFINIHLGLSPYYKGSGTNFWPLVNNEPEYVGATFMHIDAGIDTGKIIHQIRPRIYEYDGPHHIGNRLISDITYICALLLQNFDKLEDMLQPREPKEVKIYRNKDFCENATRKLYDNFKEGMIHHYLKQKNEKCSYVSILENPTLKNITVN